MECRKCLKPTNASYFSTFYFSLPFNFLLCNENFPAPFLRLNVWMVFPPNWFLIKTWTDLWRLWLSDSLYWKLLKNLLISRNVMENRAKRPKSRAKKRSKFTFPATPRRSSIRRTWWTLRSRRRRTSYGRRYARSRKFAPSPLHYMSHHPKHSTSHPSHVRIVHWRSRSACQCKTCAKSNRNKPTHPTMSV